MATTTHKKTTTKKPAKKPAPKLNSQQQTWADQASLEALVRYQPQASVLEQAYNDAQDTYAQKVQAAKASNALMQQEIARQAPAVDQHYQAAGQAQDVANGQVNGALAGLPADSPFRAAAQLGIGTSTANRASDQARASGSFGQQAVQSAQGVGFQTNQAHDSLVSDLTKILAQKQDLASQSGAYQALTYQQLHDAASKLVHDTNIHKASNSTALTIAKGHDTTSAANTAARIKAAAKGKKTATGQKLLPGGAHSTFRNNYDTASSYVSDLNISDADRQSLIQHLAGGAPAIGAKPKYNPDGSKQIAKDGTAVTTAAIAAVPKVGGLAARAAVEQALDGHISRGTQRKLANAGYSIKQLGLTTYAQWRKKGKQPGPAAAKSTISGISSAIGALTGKL